MSESSKFNASPAPKPEFSPDVMERLFYWARDRVGAAVASTSQSKIEALGEIGTLSVLGAFVSFKKRGRLRSCMGYMSDGIQLGEALDASAVTAALRDPRFPPVSADEFSDLELEIWALGSLRLIEETGEARRDAFKIGRDGLQIVGRGRRGLLLPSVPVELGWTPDEFLDGLCDKAGLPRGSWRDSNVDLFAFEGVSFKKPFVWNIYKNPELEKLVKDSHNSRDNSSRPSFSLNQDAFKLNAPATARPDPSTSKLRTQARPPAVAGMFYPGSAAEQKSALDAIEKEIGAAAEKSRFPGAMVPHAGWVYSARLAAQTLNQIEPSETIVVFAPKHRREGANLAVMPYGSWDYIGGEIPNDLEFVDDLVNAIPDFKLDATAHRSEHSIEVQLPLLARFFPNAKVVGIVVGHAMQDELDSLTDRFAAFLSERETAGRPKPLLLVSSDMNHFADEESTQKIDALALDALETTNPDELLRVVVGRRISMCGIMPAYFVLSTLKKRGEFSEALRVGHTTSAEASGDRERVVGYAGYLFR